MLPKHNVPNSESKTAVSGVLAIYLHEVPSILLFVSTTCMSPMYDLLYTVRLHRAGGNDIQG